MPSGSFPRCIPLALLALAACGGGPEGADLPEAAIQAWQGTVQAEGGAQRVRNPDRPLLPEGSVRVDTAWRAAGAAGWVRPTALALSPENVFVLDPRAGRIHVVGHAGQPGDDLGEGAGLSEPISIAWSDEIVAVGDPGRGGIVMMRESGLPLEPVRGLERAVVHGLASGGFIANPFAGRTHQWQTHGAGAESRMLELPAPPGGAAEYCASVTAGRWIVQADCAAPAFQVFDDAGTLLRQVVLDRAAPAAPAAPAPERLEAGGPADSALTRALAASEPVRAVRGAYHDPASRLFALWGQLPGGGATVDLFSEEGIYLATLRFARPWADLGFARSTLFALEEGADGQVTLAAYRLRLPSNAAQAAREAARDKAGNG